MNQHYLVAECKELCHRLEQFAAEQVNPFKRRLLQRELQFFGQGPLLEKILIGKRLAEMLQRTGVRTGTACAASMPSYLYYVLNISRLNPLAHELVFEQLLEDNPHTVPVEFVVGQLEQTRLKSLLQSIFRANVSECLDGPQPDTCDHLECRLQGSLLGQGAPLAVSHLFRFRLDRRVDRIERCLQHLRQQRGLLLRSEDIPLDDRETLIDTRAWQETWQEEALDAAALDSLFFSFRPTLDSITALTAIRQSGCRDSEPAQAYRAHLTARRPLPDRVRALWAGLLEATGGILLYREQFYHILHYLGGLDYQSAIRAWQACRGHEKSLPEEFGERFKRGALENGLSLTATRAASQRLAQWAPWLASKRVALAEVIPQAQLAFLRTRFPQVLETIGKRYFLD